MSFLGTDKVWALMAARAMCGADLAGFSIPAAEHSSITSWGREREVDANRNMLTQFAQPGGVIAVVSHSPGIHRAIREHWGRTLRQELSDSGDTAAIRPHSGARSRWC